MTAEKVREIGLRRAAERQGLRLSRSRRRDPRAVEFGRYQLIDRATDEPVLSGWLTVDEVEVYLNRPASGR